MQEYQPREIEQKWQKEWEKQALYKAQEGSKKPKLYVLDMFPYPSGSGLHVGHVEGYTATDTYARFKRMQGYNVLHPMGWDAFGLPAENYAIKTGVHPKETTEKAIDTFRRQIKDLGLSYDWSREIGTQTPEYYKWTQWFFLLLYKNNLAYKAKANVNWCDSCKTVLANEQVVDGACERCKNKVTQKEMEQWFFKITDFAEELINDLDKVDWPESTVRNQRNWIGKSEGATIKFQISTSNNQYIEVFTTRPDTLFGTTYMVLASEHKLIDELKSNITNWSEVEKYRTEAKKKSELERTELAKEKTGVELKGVKAINPANKEEIPVFIADYVLAGYGTGAIMAVPAHDERDFEFAKKYRLSIKKVIKPEPLQKFYDVQTDPYRSIYGGKAELEIEKECWEGEGILINSEQFNGMPSEKAKWEITKFIDGKKQMNYHLRDWLVSRQRYWGAPIPIVYDPEGKAHPIPEKHLPWLLPTDVGFNPTGYSPLADSKEFRERTEKIFGKSWKPEADTMDTFVCSSWYYFRFADPHNRKEFASKDTIKKWLPVDVYMGGAEHTVLHLMYARFFTKVLQKLGYIDFTEPFLKLRHQGTILAEDGRKMSKSLGNVINPDEVVAQYGADAVRLYEMFVGPLADAKPWNTRNIVGIKRFLEKAWRLQEKVREDCVDSAELSRMIQYSIKKVGDDMEAFGFNTIVSQLMICANAMEKEEKISIDAWKQFLLLLAPLAPHITEELWSQLQTKNYKLKTIGSIHSQPWPAYDSKLIEREKIRLVLQINGKVRDVVEVQKYIAENEAKDVALKNEKVQKWLAGKEPKKIIFVPGKLINFVI